ncbi:hypothetical protein D9756_002891 [Leucocoprinus leucothites]|uniref:Major facilitator superfamily (MFS) profile domain-containing protein n=1 Tax=Leucocoprinus leucothites TaxID=201217 RepID=A0A8H5G763_9AGAR|nr:hypothetical protein D9756_002891 [Leucoagaricus leucothites]
MNSTGEGSPTSTVALDHQRPSHDPTRPSSRSSHAESQEEKRAVEKRPQVHEGYHVVQRSLLSSLIIVLVATLSMIINIGNNTLVSIALPTIGREFNADPSLLQWIVSAYPLSSGCLLLVCGRLADLYGRKKAYLAGTLMLAAFTLGCGFANNILALIILRGIQGIGAAATIPASLGILAHAFPPSRARSLAFATFAAGAPVGAVFGNTMGGVLTEKTAPTWRSALFLFAGINLICFIGGAVCIDKDIPNQEEDKKVDWIGAFLITAALVLILFVLGEGETAPHGWSTGYIIALLIVGVFLAGVFIWWQWFLEKVQNRRQAKREAESVGTASELDGQGTHGGLVDRWIDRLPPPIMKISLWARAKGRFSAVMAIAFLTWSAFIGWTFWVQLYYQDYTNLQPLEVVVRLLPMFVAGVSCNAFVGVMAARLPMMAITAMGTLGTASACILFALINPNATYWAFGFPATVLSVIGVDFVFSSGTLYIAKISLPHEQSLAAALFSTMTQLGTSAGVTISTVVFNRVSSSLREGEDNIRSYRSAQWTCFAFAALGSLLSLVVFRGVGAPGDRKDKTPPQQDEERVSQDEKLATDEKNEEKV